MNSVDTRLTSAESDIGTLDTSMNSVETRLTSAESDIGTLDTSMNSVESRLTTAESDIGTLDTSMNSVESRLTSAESDIGTLDTSMNSVESRLTSAESDIGTLDTSMNSVESRLTTTETNIGTLDTSMNAVESRLTSAESDIGTLDTSMNSVESRLTTTEADINALDTSMNSVESRLTTTEADINALDTSMNSVGTLIQTAIDDLVGNAGSGYDTLVELQNEIENNDLSLNEVFTNVATKVSKSGDTMTGDLTISKGSGNTKISLICPNNSLAGLYMAETYNSETSYYGGSIRYDSGANQLKLGTGNLSPVDALWIGRGQTSVNVVGDINVGGDATINNAHIGAWISANFCAVSHSSFNTAGGYALIQSNGGATFLNSSGTNALSLRQNNADRLVINSSGNVDITNSLSIGGDITLSGNNIKTDDNELNLYSNLNSTASTGYIELRADWSKLAGKLIYFVTDTDGSNYGTTRMTIAQDGNINMTGNLTITNPNEINYKNQTLDARFVPKLTGDNRQVNWSEVGVRNFDVHFGDFNNNSTGTWADCIHFNTWGDGSGGRSNLLCLRKVGGFGMRIYQPTEATYQNTTDYTDYRDCVLADTNGNVAINNDLSVGGNVAITGKFTQTVSSADIANQDLIQTNTSIRRSQQPHHIDTYNHGTSGTTGRSLYLNYYSNSDVRIGGNSGGDLICNNDVTYKGETLDARFVNVVGDTMTGTLTLNANLTFTSSEGQITANSTFFDIATSGNADYNLRVEDTTSVFRSGLRIDGSTGLTAGKLNTSNVLQFTSANMGTETGIANRWNIGPWGGANNLHFVYGSSSKGYLDNAVDVNDINFTGQHHNYGVSELIDETGFIVSSTGNYRNQMTNCDECNKYKITINESLPIVEYSQQINDTKVWGVISDKDDTNTIREKPFGNFVSQYKQAEEDRPLTINSLGEGAVWVSNINGPITNGDYITTCVLPGLGMKQDDDVLHSYTVAKITTDCSFDEMDMVPRKSLKYETVSKTREISKEVEKDVFDHWIDDYEVETYYENVEQQIVDKILKTIQEEIITYDASGIPNVQIIEKTIEEEVPRVKQMESTDASGNNIITEVPEMETVSVTKTRKIPKMINVTLKDVSNNDLLDEQGYPITKQYQAKKAV
jgi:peptidoglycan hydrolase CwlO-like protein